MDGAHLPSIDYEPPGELSLFERWERGLESPLQAPLAVADEDYRAALLKVFAGLRGHGNKVVSIGAGNGRMEFELTTAGWNVLATDPSPRALALCREKGLATSRISLGEDLGLGTFDVIYCDGVLGHLWEPEVGTVRAWEHLGDLAHPGSACVTSNDLSNNAEGVDFTVRSSPGAAFYRPPAGRFGAEAALTGRWQVKSELIYPYERKGIVRHREVLVLRYW